MTAIHLTSTTHEATTVTSSACTSSDIHSSQHDSLQYIDSILQDSKWKWLQEIITSVGCSLLQQNCKLLCVSLFQAKDENEMLKLLEQMEHWRENLLVQYNDDLPIEIKELVSSLFLLAIDKQMDLNRLKSAKS